MSLCPGASSRTAPERAAPLGFLEGPDSPTPHPASQDLTALQRAEPEDQETMLLHYYITMLQQHIYIITFL